MSTFITEVPIIQGDNLGVMLIYRAVLIKKDLQTPQFPFENRRISKIQSHYKPKTTGYFVQKLIKGNAYSKYIDERHLLIFVHFDIMLSLLS